MKVFLIFSILVAACYTQTPTRPMIPETFQSDVDVVYYERQIYKGKGRIARNQEKGMGIESLGYTEGDEKETRTRLERYDIGEEFLIRGSGDQLHCEVRKVNNTLPLYWEWLQRAKFVGKLEYRNELVDIWDVTMSYSLISATTITIKFWERKVSQITISNHNCKLLMLYYSDVAIAM